MNGGSPARKRGATPPPGRCLLLHRAEEEPGGEKRAGKWPAFLGVPEQRTITLALLCAAALLTWGPGCYCWLDQGRAEMADRYRGSAHGTLDGTCHACHPSSDSHHHTPALKVGRDYVNEVASGGINGLLMMVATVLGGIGADIPGRGIFAMGSASLAAYSLSMGFGAFVVESANNEFALSQLREEYQEVREKPTDEVSEMICHYRKRGLSEDDAALVAGVLSKYEDFWVHHMMTEELGIQLPRGGTAALKSGLATSASFLFFGAIPLLGVTVSLALKRYMGPQWYRPQFSTLVALALSGTALSVLGVFLSRVAGSRMPLWDGMLMLANGCAASILAFGLSQVCAGVCCDRDDQASASGPVEPGQQPPCRRPSADAGPAGASAASTDSAAWPSFRRQFFHGLCSLWIGVCTLIVCMQLLERMAYESLRVFAYGWLTCITTGLGALPFLFVGANAVGEGPLAIANAVASGMMLSASVSMLMEAHEHCGPMDWQILAGLVAGGLFIRCSEQLHAGGEEEEEEEEHVVALHNAFVEKRHFRKAMLIFTVMFCHSAAEGIAVGVAFSKQLRAQFGLYVSLLLAVHNIPEGLAVALVLVPRGVSAPLATIIATLTSVPQPLLALAAFLFVDLFQWLLPLGLAFAAGAMVYVCLHELLQDSAGQLGWTRSVMVTTLSFITMSFAIAALQAVTEV